MGDKRSKYLLKNTFIFFLGNLGSKLINFFLIPLYTNILSTTEYGTIDLVSTIAVVVVPILTLNIYESVMRFSLDETVNSEQVTQIGTYVFVSTIFLGLLAIPLCNKLPHVSEYSLFVYLYIISYASTQIYLCDLRGKELLAYYSIGNILHTILIAIFNIFFLTILDMHIIGYFFAYVLANFGTFLYALCVGKGYLSFRIISVNKKLFIDMIKYSLVLIPNSFMWWIMNSSDRIMVSGMVGVAANGIYAVSYKFPTLISTLTSVFSQAWSYSAIKEKGSDDEEAYNNYIFKRLIGIVMLIGIGMMTFIKPFLRLYVSAEYFDAWKYTPFLIIGCVYLTLSTFMATSYTVHKDSFGFLFSAIFGAGFNVILNFVLIPRLEVYGAAIATCLCYIFVFLFRLFHTRKYIKYRINNIEFVGGSILIFLSSMLIFVDNIVAFWMQVLLFIFAICGTVKLWKPIFLKFFASKLRND